MLSLEFDWLKQETVVVNKQSSETTIIVDYLIVGGGYAGDVAASALRKSARDSSILLVSDEEDFPYHRHQLSKEFLLGRRSDKEIMLRRGNFYETQNIEVSLNERARRLIPEEYSLETDKGIIRYKKLLIATGASPKKHDCPGSNLEGIYYLRTIEDARRLRRLLQAKSRVVVVGGGFIGVEVACALSELGMNVSLVIQEDTIWEHLLGTEISQYFHNKCTNRGINIIASEEVQSYHGDRVVTAVQTRDQRLECDFVVTGIGSVPNTEWLTQSGLSISDGLMVDRHMRTNYPTIYAAGDVACIQDKTLSSPYRTQHWDAAREQGLCAASNMIGGSVVFEHTPSFFTSIFDIWVDQIGIPSRFDSVVVRQKSPDSFVAFYLFGQYVEAGILVNSSADYKALRKLVVNKVCIKDTRALGDLERELGSIAID